ncbi:cupredoxin domain-containing protein [Asticcacaulis sp. EMRT-3]|uniref:cupredoxin domain-containing protein n=1 Tax=Asticcacaulis sp. EMRT-3 TaxID=3040349 RepID=UPI0024AFA887|nr:cupredoxin domain-containing protein [Asticcacaulis sp. EMRT-3]MDI7776532.1 cupredoxin domain-containing protein [Asticcacaulis sp. EMRT-3]
MRRLLGTVLPFVAFVTFGLGAGSVHAEDQYIITLKNHKFTPQVMTIPADTKVKVTIKNQDTTPAEFESNELNREKIVGGNSQITVFIGPLKTGLYGYFDDFHKATTTGKIEAK